MGTYTSNEQALGDPSKQSESTLSEVNGHWRAAMEADVRAIEADARALEAEAVRFTEDILAETHVALGEDETESSTGDVEAAPETKGRAEEPQRAVDETGVTEYAKSQEAGSSPTSKDEQTDTQGGTDQQPPSSF